MIPYTSREVTETSMLSRSIVIAVLLACGNQAFADPPKSAPAQPQPQPAHAVVLAAAEAVQDQAPETAQSTPAQPRHRIARVTTCRCGDPQPGDATDDSSDR